MSQAVELAHSALNRRYFLDFPREAARQLEFLPPADIAALLAVQPTHAIVRCWQQLTPDVGREVLALLTPALAAQLLAEAEPAASASVLAQFEPAERETLLRSLHPGVARELAELLNFPEHSAGSLMDPELNALRADFTVQEALQRLGQFRRRGLRELFVVDASGKLDGRVEMQDLALAAPAEQLRTITRPLRAAVQALAPRDEVVDALQRHPITELPVIDPSGRFMGVIHQEALVSAIEQESSVDIQTMVGASRDERALSGALFAVRKRLPWLQINLLTAFLAAAVVGLFESTIAKFTALAVLLPVVAGQSGNAGAQALAVTMRGLVLREMTLRQWPRLVWKEAGAGFINGMATAATTALGVYIWSRSTGLVLIIMSAMVISMVVAGIAGALVPVVLRRIGQDPATASSIILTTVTDVTGFFSFLGIATLLSATLLPGS